MEGARESEIKKPFENEKKKERVNGREREKKTIEKG
jgi:hypothetical protein